MSNDDWILEDELDAIPSYCDECGQVHGMEACQYEDSDADDCMDCGQCDSCIERTRAYFEEMANEQAGEGRET